MIRFTLKNGRSQFFSKEEHGDFFKDMADRFHLIHGHRIVSRETLTKQTMQLVSMSTESATLVTADGRTVVVTEGLPVSVTPQDIQPAPEEVTPDAPVEPAPEAPVEPAADDSAVEPVEAAPAA